MPIASTYPETEPETVMWNRDNTDTVPLITFDDQLTGAPLEPAADAAAGRQFTTRHGLRGRVYVASEVDAWQSQVADRIRALEQQVWGLQMENDHPERLEGLNEQADAIVNRARTEAADILNAAHRQADALLDTAEQTGAEIMGQAKADAEKLADDATAHIVGLKADASSLYEKHRARATAIEVEAHREADRLIEAAEDHLTQPDPTTPTEVIARAEWANQQVLEARDAAQRYADQALAAVTAAATALQMLGVTSEPRGELAILNGTSAPALASSKPRRRTPATVKRAVDTDDAS